MMKYIIEHLEEGLDLQLPFRFVEINGKPFISKEFLL